MLVKHESSAQASLFDAAPAWFLDQFEELRMELSDQQLIAEAIETNVQSLT